MALYTILDNVIKLKNQMRTLENNGNRIYIYRNIQLADFYNLKINIKHKFQSYDI